MGGGREAQAGEVSAGSRESFDPRTQSARAEVFFGACNPRTHRWPKAKKASAKGWTQGGGRGETRRMAPLSGENFRKYSKAKSIERGVLIIINKAGV